MSRTQEHMRDVVLEEADGSGLGADAPGRGRVLPAPLAPPSSSGRRAARRRRLRLVWPFGVVLVLAAGAGVVDAVQDDTAAGAAPSAGALAPVDGPVRELWRRPDLSLHGFDRVDGLLVGPAQRPDGAVEAVGIDATTGVDLWTTTLSADGERTGGASCATPDARPTGTRTAGGSAAEVETASGRVTVCVVVDEQGPVDDFSPSGVLEPTASRRVLLDPGTGRVLQDEPTPPSTSIAALGADVVSGHLDDDGRLVVRRSGALDADVRWTFVSPEPLGATEYGRWAWIDLVDGLVVAGGDFGWVLTADGRPVRSWEPPPRGGGWLETLPSGLMVQPGPGTGLASEVVELHSGRTVVLPGRPFAPAVDDGSLGDVVLGQTSQNRLAAFSVTTGRELWSVPDAGGGGSGVVVVEDRVVRMRADAVEALDASTGETLWRTPADTVRRFTLLTDGQAVLCVVVRPDRGPVLAAYALDDGSLRWEADLADDVEHLFVVDGALFAQATDGMVAFG